MALAKIIEKKSKQALNNLEIKVIKEACKLLSQNFKQALSKINF